MSFRVNWPQKWNEPFIKKLSDELEFKINSLDHGVVYIIEKIKISDFEFGTVPPKIKLLKIHELNNTNATFSFSVKYNGDFKLSFKTKVDINERTVNPPKYQFSLGSFGVSPFQDKPCILPVSLSISNLVIDAEIKVFVFYDLEKMIKEEYERKTRVAVFLVGNPFKSFTLSTNLSEIPLVESFLKSKLTGVLDDLAKSMQEDGIKFEV